MTVPLPRLRTRAGTLLMSIAAAVACLLLPGPVSAETPILEVLQVGWDGQMVQGSWSPVRIRLTGGSSDLSARVEVISKSRLPTGPQAAPIEYATGAYGQEVALPAGVAKEVTLWLPANSDMGPAAEAAASVRLVADGRTVAEDRVEFKTAKIPFWPLVGVLADSPSVARALTQIELPVQGLPVPLSVARLAAADLTPSPERLGALSSLVVQGSAATTLTNEQRTALRQWVTAGGHLILSGGPDAPRVASILPTDALPVSFSGADGTADLSALGTWAEFRSQPLATGPAARFRAGQGSLLAGSTDRPLAWRFGLGKGTVTLLAADPGLEPLTTWSGTPALLRKALEPALPSSTEMDGKMRYAQSQQRDPANQLRGAVEALPPDALPDWKNVALLLGGFLLVVGPGLHLVLWRTDRRMWSWAVVPAAAVLVAGGMYYVGVGRDGRDVLINVVSHVRLDPEGGRAKQDLLAGFFGPTHSTLAVDVPGDGPVRPGLNSGLQPYSSYGKTSGSADPPFHVISGRDTRVEFDSGQWGMRTVALSRWLDDARGITADLQLERGLIKGTIRNDTPYLMEDAGVLVGQAAVKLGSLAPGQTASVVLDPGPSGTRLYQDRYPTSWRLFGKPRSAGASGSSMGVAVAVSAPALSMAASSTGYTMPGGMQEPLEVPQDPEVQRRIRLMDPIVNVPQMGPGSQSMPLTFIAFTQAPVGTQLPSAEGHPTFHLAVLDQLLQLKMPPGPFTIPPALSPAEMVSQSGGLGGGGNGTFTWMELQGGSVVYQFHPPLPSKAKAETVAITTRQMGQSSTVIPGKGIGRPPVNTTPGPAENGIFSVYDWKSASWEPLPGGTEVVRLQPASSYVGSDGSVRLQVTAGTDRSVMFLQPELTIEGTVEE